MHLELIDVYVDAKSIDFLDNLGVSFFKMASADLTNFPLLEHTAKKNKPIILSTGMSDLNDIYLALEQLKRSGSKTKNITILHCTSEYPAPFSEVNLNAMNTIRDKFEIKVVSGSGVDQTSMIYDEGYEFKVVR